MLYYLTVDGVRVNGPLSASQILDIVEAARQAGILIKVREPPPQVQPHPDNIPERDRKRGYGG